MGKCRKMMGNHGKMMENDGKSCNVRPPSDMFVG